jgi:hypothetical protein
MRIFYLIALLTVIGSCTITKRVHNPGWHVEWRTNYITAENENPSFDQHILLENAQINTQEQEPSEFVRLNSIPEYKDTERPKDGVDEMSSNEAKMYGSEYKSRATTKQIAGEENTKETPVNQKKIYPLSIVSLVVIILSYIFIYLGIFAAFSFFVISAFLLILAFILAMVSWKKIKYNPEKWAGKKLTLTLFILSSNVVLGLIYGLLLYYYLKE